MASVSSSAGGVDDHEPRRREPDRVEAAGQVARLVAGDDQRGDVGVRHKRPPSCDPRDGAAPGSRPRKRPAPGRADRPARARSRDASGDRRGPSPRRGRERATSISSGAAGRASAFSMSAPVERLDQEHVFARREEHAQHEPAGVSRSTGTCSRRSRRGGRRSASSSSTWSSHRPKAEQVPWSRASRPSAVSRTRAEANAKAAAVRPIQPNPPHPTIAAPPSIKAAAASVTRVGTDRVG